MNNPIKILLLDDDERVRFNLKLFLEDEGFECYESISAEQALKSIESIPFDIAIVDIRLPGKTGEEFIFEAAAKSPATKYIIYTGSNDYELPNELISLGIGTADVLNKPVTDMRIFIDKIIAKLES
jgi:two-component system, OmpR family, response regulator